MQHVWLLFAPEVKRAFTKNGLFRYADYIRGYVSFVRSVIYTRIEL